MERHKVQFWLNPKNRQHYQVLQKLQESGREEKDYIIDAILAYAAPESMSEGQFRRILREELEALGADARLAEQKNETLQEPVKILENQKLPEIPDQDETQDKAFLPEEDDEDITLGLGMLAAFEGM